MRQSPSSLIVCKSLQIRETCGISLGLIPVKGFFQVATAKSSQSVLFHVNQRFEAYLATDFRLYSGILV